jgi:cytochrome P450
MRAIAHMMTVMALATPALLPIPRLRGETLFGNLASFKQDRVGLLLQAARTNAIVGVPMGVVRNVFVVSTPALVHEVLVTKQASFSKSPGMTVFMRPVLGKGVLTASNEDHPRQRKRLAPVFAPKRIAMYGDTMAAIARTFAERLRDGEELELTDAMMTLTLEVVGRTLFDADVRGDASAVGDAITTAMEVTMLQMGSILPIPPSIPTPANLRYKRAVAKLDAVIYRIIEDRRREGSDRGDVLSVMLETKDEAGVGMTDVQIRDEAMTLFAAGHETTANALAWAFYLLAKNPDVRAKLEAEVDALGHDPSFLDLPKLPYTLAVLKETMRLNPPAYMMGRRVLSDVMIGDHAISKGSIVIVNVMGLHHDPASFVAPGRFDPERFLGEREKAIPRGAYLPFGAGPRVCIGNHFAMMEGHLLLATIARRARIEIDKVGPIQQLPLVTLRPERGLMARVALRS